RCTAVGGSAPIRSPSPIWKAILETSGSRVTGSHQILLASSVTRSEAAMLTYRGRFPSPAMEKLIITVAPTGSVPRKKDTPHVPVTPDEIAETAYLCEQPGAAVIHVHCRDENERPTSRFELFKETVDKIRKRTKLIIMTSTSGIAGA